MLRVAPLVAFLAFLGGNAYPDSSEVLPGIVVSVVQPDSTAARAGLQPGDILLSWRRGPAPPANPESAEGQLLSPFDLLEIMLEQSPRGEVILEGLRVHERRRWALPAADTWGIISDPRLSGEALRLLEEAVALSETQKPGEAARVFGRMAQTDSGGLPPLTLAWLKYREFEEGVEAGGGLLADAERIVSLLMEEGRGAFAAVVAFRSARRLAAAGREVDEQTLVQPFLEARCQLRPESLTHAEFLEGCASAFRLDGNQDLARKAALAALETREQLAPASLPVAESLSQLGVLALTAGNLDEADRFWNRAVGLRKALAPQSIELAADMYMLGWIALRHDDLGRAQQELRAAVEILRARNEESDLHAAAIHELGVTLERAGDLLGAEGLYRQSLALTEKLAPDSLDVATRLNNLGAFVDDRGDLAAAEDLHRRALEIRKELAPGSLDVAASLNNLANVASDRGDLAAAEDLHRRALEIRKKLAPGSLDVAASLGNLGNVAFDRGDLAAAEDLYRGALEIRKELAPGSLDVAGSLGNLGNVAADRGDLAAAEDLYRGALEIRKELAPGSLAVAGSLGNLGNVVESHGDLAEAEELQRQALAIRESLAPDSLDVAMSLTNLGVLASRRGDLAAADQFDLQALAIEKELAPGSLAVAVSLNNLGDTAHERGDLAAAVEFHRQSLAIRERLAPGSLALATTLNNLGGIARDLADFSAAAEYYRKSLAIREKLAPDSPDVAMSLDSLGLIAQTRGDFAAAEKFHRRALAINERCAPGSRGVAASLASLAGVAFRRNDFGVTEELLHRSLAIDERVAPRSLSVVRSLHNLGLVARARGDAALARERFCRAVDILETQVGNLGGTDQTRSAFSANWAFVYRNCERVLLELGEKEEAFHILERSRARSLRQMLAERDLLFSDIPGDLESERRLVNAEYDRTQEALGQLSPERDKGEVEELRGRLEQLGRRQAEIVQKIREASPRLAALQYPQPLVLTGVREALDPGTLLLSYSVGEEETVLFVVRPRATGPPGDIGLSVFTLPVGEAALRERVRTVRRVVARGAISGRGVLVTEDNTAPSQDPLAHELYDLLVRPAEALIARSERVLISPDGPLHTLPFVALVRMQGGSPQNLVEWKPLHVVVSGTVYAELKKDRENARSAEVVELVAFGDPRYPAMAKDSAGRFGDATVRSAARRGFGFESLPFTREEVHAVTELYPDSSRIYLGEEATEGRVKGIGKAARILHFACHGLVDERFPLNSALVLTIPENPKEGEDNGLLQAWEIFESVRLDADLVVLSACGTGLGREVGGEGLVGLTRAFQYAGARTVVASLWSVADESTSKLMKTFYASLKKGMAKDEALRMAQIALMRDPKTAHPFHWAAFEVIGDWK